MPPKKRLEPAPPENKPIWERWQNEPAKWYRRFTIYLDVGYRRSIEAAYKCEQLLKLIEEGVTSEAELGMSPYRICYQPRKIPAEVRKRMRLGTEYTWGANAKRYHWEERADAYEDEQARLALEARATALKKLHASASEAVEALIEGLNHPSQRERRQAAVQILDRAGLPRTERQEVSGIDGEPLLGKMTDAELERIASGSS
jgi:hypothetical protein